LGNTYVETKILHLLKFRIPKLSNKHKNDLASLIDAIIVIIKDETSMSNMEKQDKIKTIKTEIDQLVYKLYGLTQEEIKIVEGEK
jgi:hypothetical protein